jgi:hypothetical protein
MLKYNIIYNYHFFKFYTKIHLNSHFINSFKFLIKFDVIHLITCYKSRTITIITINHLNINHLYL